MHSMPRPKNTAASLSRPSKRPALTLTCARCRARKVKCDGRTPECKTCQAYGAQCHYDKIPSMSQVVSMSQRIEELERMLASENSDNSQMEDVQDLPRPVNLPRAVSVHRDLASSSTLNNPSPQFESTSAVMDPAHSNHDHGATFSNPRTEDLSSMDEAQMDFWHSNAVAAASAQLRLPQHKIEHLFKTYWTWVFPVFLFVSKPHFLLGGRYSSPLLVSVICLQATRFTDHVLKEELHAHVRLHLSQEIFREPSIPTLQALLQLSGRDLGNGSLYQAWLYSGMAFRMAVDMGIFTRPRNPNDDPTDIAVRGQLAWSCFAWDKAVSLYLGRTPSLPEPPDFDPFVPDETLEDRLWSPHLDPGIEGINILPLRCFGVSCFANFCKLVVVINEILVTVYGKKPDRDPTLIKQIRGKLEAWWLNTPQHLRVEQTSPCPAPHVLSQNMLFHTSKILLHRPFWANASCRTICQDAGKAVERLLVLFESTFGLTHMTYLTAYCAYTAATVAMLDLHDHIEGSQQRVNTYLRILYGVRTSCPGIQRSIDIIIDGFSRVTPAAPSAPMPPTSQPGVMQERMEGFDMLPAFPFDNYNDLTGLNMGDNSAVPFGSLDAYAFDWSLLAGQGLDNLPG